jgi:hypothetical protein
MATVGRACDAADGIRRSLRGGNTDRCAAGNMIGNKHPQPGDVVITSQGRSRRSFGVSTTPEPPQLSFTSFEQALARARRFAEHAYVDVWLLEGAGDIRLVASHRVGVQRPSVSEAQERK